MIRLTLYTRPECHLCDAAKFVLTRVRRDVPFELIEVDISAPGNEGWLALYGRDIPVACAEGQEWFRHRVVEADLRRRLHGLSERSGGTR